MKLTDCEKHGILLDEVFHNLKERATDKQLQQIALTLQDPSGELVRPLLIDETPKEFLLKSLWLVNIKTRERLVKGVWTDLAQRIPNAVAFDQDWESYVPSHWLYPKEKAKALRCVYWACVIALARKSDPPPQDCYELMKWCDLFDYWQEKEAVIEESWRRLTEFARNASYSNTDRERLGLALDIPLTQTLISKAFREKARIVHPDMGGNATDFTRLVQSKDRLLALLG